MKGLVANTLTYARIQFGEVFFVSVSVSVCMFACSLSVPLGEV